MSKGWAKIAVNVKVGVFLPFLVGCLRMPAPLSPEEEAMVATPAKASDPGSDSSTEGQQLWRARNIPEIYAEGEVRYFEFWQEERLVGRSWGKFIGTREDDSGEMLYGFMTRIELYAGKQEKSGEEPALRSENEVWVDKKGRLHSGYERGAVSELIFKVENDNLEIEARDNLGKVQRESLAYGDERDAFMGYMSILHEEMMFALRDLRMGSEELRLLSLSAGLANPWTGRVSKEVVKGSEKAMDEVVIRSSFGEDIRFRKGKIYRVEIKDDKLDIRSQEMLGSSEPWPEWSLDSPEILRYTKPGNARFDIREIELPGRGDEPVLKGEVLSPKGTKAGSSHAGVIFLGGSAPSNRYGFAGPPAVDFGSHVITDALANAGYVVLRYDERGTGESESAEYSWESQLEDARRAFRTLMIQEGVDPERILVVGHGEGGWRALQLAAERPNEVIGVALLASESRSFRQRLNGDPQAASIVAAIEKGKTVSNAMKPFATYYRQILDVDPLKMIKDTDCAIYIAQGGKDFEVDVKVATKSLSKVAKKNKKRKVESRTFPNLDHLFKAINGESTQESYLMARRVDPAFVQSLVSWARRVTKK